MLLRNRFLFGVALFVALSLAFVSSIHLAVDTGRTPQDPQLAAFLAAGGAAGALCLSAPADGEDGSGRRAECPACRLVAGAGLPPPMLAVVPAALGMEARLRPVRERAGAARAPLSPSARGPPSGTRAVA